MSDTSSPLLWPAGTDPAAWMRSWTQAFAPQNLVQPILPGWTLNVNAFNSSAPQTEAEVLQKHSYGRQLGRIADALAVLIAAAPAKVRGEEAVVTPLRRRSSDLFAPVVATIGVGFVPPFFTTAGRPQAWASITARPRVSVSLGNTNRSHPR